MKAQTARSDHHSPGSQAPLLAKYPIPNALNAAVAALQLGALAGCFFALSQIRSFWALAALALVFGLLMNSVYSTIHESHHRILFSSRRANDAAGVLLAFFFPASFHLLRQGHLGHHRRNRSDDEAFDLYFERDNIAWKFFAWYGILTGLYWLLVAASSIVLLLSPFLFNSKLYSWDRTSEVFLSHFRPETMRIMRLEALGALGTQALLFWLTGASWQYYLAMYYGFGLMWSSLQYVHHYQAERDVIDGAHNLHLWAPIDLLWLNHNWHHTHHSLPTIPWCYLPDLAQDAGTESSPLLPAYLRMWRGPQPAESGVENRYTGEVSK